MTRVLVVSGTGTGVGKTVVTAAIADLAAALDAPVTVVAAAGLGTLNHTALTLEALAARKPAPAGVVIGFLAAAAAGLAECLGGTRARSLTGL